MAMSDQEKRVVESDWTQCVDEDGVGDLFADPDPLDHFNFEWTIDDKHVTICLEGYKRELGQLLHSTGLTLWRAAELLCDYLLVKRDVLVKGKKVLEVGAGLGLCGILASKLGARETIMTDGDTDSLANMWANMKANKCNNVLCRQLIWDRRVDEFVREHGTFELILGADVIYMEQFVAPLWSTVDRLLDPSGTFFLAYTRRNVKIDVVLAEATKRGFVWTTPEDAEGVYVFVRSGA